MNDATTYRISRMPVSALLAVSCLAMTVVWTAAARLGAISPLAPSSSLLVPDLRRASLQRKVVNLRQVTISLEPAVRPPKPAKSTVSGEVKKDVPPKPLAPKRLRNHVLKVAASKRLPVKKMPVKKMAVKKMAVKKMAVKKVTMRRAALGAPAQGFGGRVVRGASSKQDEEKDANNTNLLLPESSDLNRILEKATEFFAKDPARWGDGIEFIQGLLEGTTEIEVGPDHLNDPRYSVYSGDSRLYIPFTEYCQDLLASLPPEGLEVYRGLWDAKAETSYEQAAADLDQTRLEELSRLYFATSVGPKILSLLADLATLQGDLPKAVHLRERLLRSYPDLSEAQAADLRLHQLQAYALLGDLASFEDMLQEMKSLAPEASYRVAGELVPLDEVPELEAFHIREPSVLNEAVATARTAGNSEGMDLGSLVPIWDFRFFDSDPYHLRKTKNSRNNTFWFGGQGAMYVPSAKDARPGIFGTAFGSGPRRHFAIKDHESLVILDMLSGIPLARDPDPRHKKRVPGRSNNNRATLRVRLPSNDYAQQRVAIVDGDLYLTVRNRVTTNMGRGSTAFPYGNELLRYRPATESWETFPKPKPTVYFEGPPLGYGEWLYVPVRKKKSFGLAKLRKSDGVLDSVVTVHSGGSRYLRPPSVPPVRIGHQIIQLTNAGCVASFSLPNMELRWLRRYETWMRSQPPPRTPVRSNRRWSGVQKSKLRFWNPVDPIVVGDKIVLAPVDADTLICLDVQSGKLEWILPRSEKKTRDVEFKQILGPSDGRIYLIGDHVQCVDVPSGKRMWEVEVGADRSFVFSGTKAQGLGTLVGEHILLPLPSGEVAVLSTEDGHHEQLLTLPSLRVGEKSIEAPFNLQVDGPILLALSEVRVAAFTVPETLLAAAGDSLDRVDRLLVSGQSEEAWRILGQLLASRTLGRSQIAQARRLYIRLSGEISDSLKAKKHLDKALAFLADAEKKIADASKSPVPEFVLFRIKLLEGSGRNKELRDMREILAGIDVDAQPAESDAESDAKEQK